MGRKYRRVELWRCSVKYLKIKIYNELKLKNKYRKIRTICILNNSYWLIKIRFITNPKFYVKLAITRIT
jgi:hypothetical protein